MRLSDAEISVACDDLGTAIHCPLKWGFRRRLRSKTAPEPDPLPAPQYEQLAATYGPSLSMGLPLLSTSLPLLTPTVQPSTPARSYLRSESLAASAHSESTSPAETVHMAAAAEAPPGETRAHHHQRGTLVFAGGVSSSTYTNLATPQRRAAFVQDTTRWALSTR